MRTTFTVNSQKSHGSCTSFSQRTTDSNTLAKKKERKTHTQCRQHTLLRACAYETLLRITTHSRVVHKKKLYAKRIICVQFELELCDFIILRGVQTKSTTNRRKRETLEKREYPMVYFVVYLCGFLVVFFSLALVHSN